MQSWLEQARVLSGLSVEECAQALYQSEASYICRENNPGILTLDELRVLMTLFSREANSLVLDVLQELTPSR